MPAGPSSLSLSDVHRGLQRLRRGPGLARPASLLELSPALVRHVVEEDGSPPAPSDVPAILQRVRRAVDQLSLDERTYAEVELGLSTRHAYATLTERQESLARELGCTWKTVRRRADRALESVALALLTDERQPIVDPSKAEIAPAVAGTAAGRGALAALRSFWGLGPSGRVDVVCSEIPDDERPDFASPTDRNYLRYAKFADLDTLIFTRTRLAQLQPSLTVRDFSPSEYYDTETDVLIVIGGPPWNAKYRQVLPQLPFHFEPHELGEDDPLVVPAVDVTMGPHWTASGDLVEDIAVFTRLSLAHGTKVFLFGGCLTLGVLGAASLFLRGDHGARNVAYATELVGERDVVVVTEVRRVGGIADLPELDSTEPLLVLARDDDRTFGVLVDNTKRYLGS